MEDRIIPEELYDVNSIADIVGQDPSTIRRHIRNGKLKAYRGDKTGTWRIIGKDAIKWMGVNIFFADSGQNKNNSKDRQDRQDG